MQQGTDRKEQESELHDHLRGDLADDPRYTSNKKFYAVSESNRAYVRGWLAERCPGKRVLDYCCGNGSFTIWLAEAGAEAYGIDISPVSIQNASSEAARRGLGDKAKFFVMDAEASQFESGYFDFAVVNGVLHHLDLDRAYRELGRILKPDGAVIWTEAMRHNPFLHWYRRRTPHLRSAWEVDHILGEPEIEMARQYFHKVEVAQFFHLATIACVPFRDRAVFRPMLNVMRAVDSVLLRLPMLKWWAWMAVFILAQPKRAASSN